VCSTPASVVMNRYTVAFQHADPIPDRSGVTDRHSGRPKRRTAQKYSNASSRERLRQAAARQRPAPTTANDLAARSSHRGGQGFKSPQLDAKLQVAALFRGYFWLPILAPTRHCQPAGPCPAQVALAWLLGLAPNILLLPGTSSVRHPGGNRGSRRYQARRAHTGATGIGKAVTARTCRPAAEPPTCDKSWRLVVGPWPWLQGPVDVPSVFDPQDDHLMEVVANPVEDLVSAAAGGPYTSQVVT
jgi:hypothetical protein